MTKQINISKGNQTGDQQTATMGTIDDSNENAFIMVS
jgi:hypothetical protein